MADNAGGLLADIDGAAGEKGGALPLEEGEDMCAEATGVSLRVNGTKIIKASRCVVTSYRILYAAPGEGTCKGLNLSDVAGVETKSASALGLFRMPKIVLTMEGGVVLQMSFHDSGMAAFKTALDTALRMALWRTRPAAATMEARHNSGEREFNTSSAGVAGLLARQQERVAAVDADLETAFADLGQLMEKAAEMVALAGQFRSAQRSSAEEGDFRDYMVSMGIASPVTRANAGSDFHTQLARELDRVLPGALARGGGMLTLPDVFCLFNRARATELISPEDLLKACTLLDTVGAGISYHAFESGVKVLKSADFDNATVTTRLVEMAEAAADANGGPRSGALTAVRAAEALGISVVVAKEHLLAGEDALALARDASVEGLTFFVDRFDEFLDAG